METQMDWKRNTAKHTNGELLFVGVWNIGGVNYDGCTSKDDPLKYCAKCTLPGIKDRLGYFKTTDEAKVAVEKAVTYWISRLLLKGTD